MPTRACSARVQNSLKISMVYNMKVAVDVSPKLPFKRPSSPLLIGTHPTTFGAILRFMDQ